MKKIFSGIEVSPTSKMWRDKSRGVKWLSGDIVMLARTDEHQIKTYIHPEYAACEYKLKLNIFSFGRLKLNIPFTVIAPPVSVDISGYCGNIGALIEDYKRRKGLFLMLNLREDEIGVKSKAAAGKTLPGCIFENRFDSFEEYINAFRSSYRKRIKIALDKGKYLQIHQIDNACFNDELYNLYLQVLAKSDFPLEKLPMRFFQNCGCKIDVFYNYNKPLAFVMHETDRDNMKFIFGGMDYASRDEYDLYYNMLLHLVSTGIQNKAKTINFGQTAETTKCRIGCVLEDRYMLAFSGNGFITDILCLFAPLLQNNKKIVPYNAFKRKLSQL